MHASGTREDVDDNGVIPGVAMAHKKKQSKNDDWRQFEKLVTRIERTLAPNARVKHNDSVWDYESEGYRQVDVTIRSEIGPTPILITVECRKRGRKSDVNWIDELAEKKVGIRADKTIAVSSKPITAPAMRKAKKKNIDVHLMSEITGDNIRSWLGWEGVMVYEERTIGFLNVAVEIYDYEEAFGLDEDALESLERDTMRAKIFSRTDGTYSAANFIDSWFEAFNEKGGAGDLFEGVERNGTPRRMAISDRSSRGSDQGKAGDEGSCLRDHLVGDADYGDRGSRIEGLRILR